MRILVNGDNRNRITFACRGCGCIYQMNLDEVKVEICYSPYPSVYKSNCPECGYENVVRRGVSG